MSRLDAMLLRHELLRLKPYADAAGKITIGVGRNLTDDGITNGEALLLLQNDILTVQKEAATFKWFPKLDAVRQDAICDMLFNLGLTRFCEFRFLIRAMEDEDYSNAATQMLNSHWAAQVGKRAAELAQMIRTGQYQGTLQ